MGKNKQPDDNSGFATEGYESFPALYHDSQRIHDVAVWSGPMLTQRLVEYDEFLHRDDLMPRARETATRILKYMQFEQDCQSGFYEQVPDDVSEITE